MRSVRSRFFGAALLPLLILSSWLGTGGWFCANGSRCEPPLAASCCCGCPADRLPQASPAASDCCSRETGARFARLTPDPCGCYYELQVIDSLLPAWQILDDLGPAPSVAVEIAVGPVGRVRFGDLASPGPQRFLVSPRDARAPPAG